MDRGAGMPDQASSGSGVSKPEPKDYSYKKRFYRDEVVAGDYDRRRFTTPKRQRRNLRKWRTIRRALQAAEGVHTILDVPCGTGRFTGALARQGYQVFGSDISLEMMAESLKKDEERHSNVAGHVQADAERLPLRDRSVDCVMSIRFMFHVDPPTRIRILREMGRVSRRWLVIDYRHRYSYRYTKWRLFHALGLTRKELERVSTRQLKQEFREAGLEVRRIVPVARFFSDKWIVLGEVGPVTA
jgi:SAM-dependent methyltransferase